MNGGPNGGPIWPKPIGAIIGLGLWAVLTVYTVIWIVNDWEMPWSIVGFFIVLAGYLIFVVGVSLIVVSEKQDLDG